MGSTTGKKCYTNGVINIFISPKDAVPENFKLGSKPRTLECCEKIRQAKKGNTIRKGCKLSKETKDKISASNKNKIPWNKEKKLSEEEKLKIINTKIKKYGSLDAAYDSMIQKTKATFLENYGVDNPNKNKIIKDKRKKTISNIDNFYDNRAEKSRKTKIEKYGSLENAELNRLNTIRKNNPDYFVQWRDKISQTMRNNETFNKSKPEDMYYDLLLSLYDNNDVVRQYKDERYPFNCDFYIKSEDLFIELNLSWVHGGHAFNIYNENDIRILSNWQEKAKTSKYYENAIYIWTDLDVRKQLIANKNNLNYISIYTM